MVLFAAPLGIIAAGQTLVMLTGGIDLSVASVATASAYLMATHSALGGAPAVLCGLGVGLVVGLINGVGIALLRVQPLVMTLGTGLMTEGMLVVYSQKMMADAPRVPQFIENLGAGKILGRRSRRSAALGADRACSSSSSCAARDMAGCSTPSATTARPAIWRAFASGACCWSITSLCSLLAAIAGLVIVGGTDAADLSLADVYLLPSVAAVIIGGTSIFGGRGGYSGTIVGALILTVLNSILTLLDAPEPIRQILYGAIILLLAAAYTRLTD